MKKKTKIILITLSTLLIIGGAAGYWIYDKATDYLIANVFESLLREDLAAAGVLGEDGEIDSEKVGQLASGTGKEATVETTIGEEALSQQQGANGESNAQTAEAPSANQTLDSPELSNSLTNQSPNQLTTSTKTIEERVKEIVSTIPVRDKNAVMRLIMQNVSSDDIRYLSSLVTDGHISSSDIAKAKEVALRSFNAEQLEDVKYYYYKYIGLFAEFY